MTSADQVTMELFVAGNPGHRAMFDALGREWLEAYGFLEAADEHMLVDPEGAILGEGGVILFARLNDAIIGTGALLKCEEGVYEIAKMGVTASQQGAGIGRAIAEALIAQARALGASKLYIASNRKLERALTLYRNLGFRELPQAEDQRYATCDITMEMLLYPNPKEIGGRKGPDPTRYGDWESAGRCVDF